jgi:transposase-like protein
MLPIEEVVTFLNSQDVPRIPEAARKFDVNCSTLYKKFRRQSGKIPSSTIKAIPVRQTIEDTRQAYQ